MTSNTAVSRKSRTGRTLVAAAVSAAIVGAVAVSRTLESRERRAGRGYAATMTTMHGGFADLVQRGAAGGRQCRGHAASSGPPRSRA